MKTRPLVCTTAAMTVLALCTTAGGASAATAAAARGTATSALTLLSVQAGGHALSLGEIAQASGTTSGAPQAKVTVTPLSVDGNGLGTTDVTPATGPATVAAQSTPDALAALVSLSSPSFAASASDSPSTSAGASSLGTLKLLGFDIPLSGALSSGSSVSATKGALANKTVSLEGLALPSVADILAALGLDLNALPVDTLTDLFDQLNLVNAAVDSAQAALTAAAADLDAKVAQLASANAVLASATAALSTVVATVDTTTYPLVTSLSSFLAVADKSPILADTAGLSTSLASYTTAQGLVDAANALVNTAQATLNTAVTTVKTAVESVLDGTPLVSLDRLEVSSRVLTTSASKGGQTAQLTGGQVEGLKVLGTDVLKTALGDSLVDVSALTGSVATLVNSTISTLTGTLSSVLSQVAGLSVPAPQVALLGKTTSTSIKNGFGNASAVLSGLRITLPAITVPTSLAVPGAPQLPALLGVDQVVGALTSAPVQLDLVSLSDQSAFAPAVTSVGTPTVTPSDTQLPRTGLPAGIALVALITVGGAVVVRRRATAQ